MFGAAPTPTPPALPDPLPTPPSYASGSDRSRPAGNRDKVTGFGSTLLTGPEGVTAPTNTAKKSLLGQ